METKISAVIIEDEELSARWVVHPFLFHVDSPEKVKIDWEHKEIKWIDPADTGKYDTVPGLKNTLARVMHT